MNPFASITSVQANVTAGRAVTLNLTRAMQDAAKEWYRTRDESHAEQLSKLREASDRLFAR